jgi:hypothetical protein
MEIQNKRAMTAEDVGMSRLEPAQLAAVTGGSTLPYGSNFSEWPPARSFAPVIVQPFNQDESPSRGVPVVRP